MLKILSEEKDERKEKKVNVLCKNISRVSNKSILYKTLKNSDQGFLCAKSLRMKKTRPFQVLQKSFSIH